MPKLNWKNILTTPKVGDEIKIVTALEELPPEMQIGMILKVIDVTEDYKYKKLMPDLVTTSGTIFGGEYEVVR